MGTRLRIISKITLLLIAGAGALVAVVFFPNWLAARRAQQFCDETPIGSDISAAIIRANERKTLWGSHRFYTFYFPGLILDKAVCNVSVAEDGKVKAKGALMEID